MSIAVDLDGTLAHYDRWRGIEHIGDPVPVMLYRVRVWLSEGKEVVIFTARITPHPAFPEVDRERAIVYIREWLDKHGLQEVKRITNIKSQDMEEFWDDRAVPVVVNSGIRFDR